VQTYTIRDTRREQNGYSIFQVADEVIRNVYHPNDQNAAQAMLADEEARRRLRQEIRQRNGLIRDTHFVPSNKNPIQIPTRNEFLGLAAAQSPTSAETITITGQPGESFLVWQVVSSVIQDIYYPNNSDLATTLTDTGRDRTAYNWLAGQIRSMNNLGNSLDVRIRVGTTLRIPSKSAFEEQIPSHLSDGFHTSSITTTSVERTAPPANSRNKRIMIDPGHGDGSTNAGTEGNMSRNGGTQRRYWERDLVLEFALAAETALRNAGFTVILTRRNANAPLPNNEEDTDIAARWQMGARENVDAFISIHFNGADNAAIHGTETFYAQPRARTDRPFATAIHNAVRRAIGTYDRGVKPDSSLPQRELGVLRRPDPNDNPTHNSPRALIEIEFMTNITAMNRLGANFDRNLVSFGRELANAMTTWFAR